MRAEAVTVLVCRRAGAELVAVLIGGHGASLGGAEGGQRNDQGSGDLEGGGLGHDFSPNVIK
ncbi:hypothetical protein D3C85_1544890 [compost metagenome]